METALATKMMTYLGAKECVTNIRSLVLDLYEKVRGVASFETYIRDRFGMARRTAYQLIDASKVIENVRNCAQIEVLPATESQTRPLTRLKDDPEKQRVAWQKAVETAPEGKVTAAHVQKVVREMVAEPKKKEPKDMQPRTARKVFPEPAYGIFHAISAISHLERISASDPERFEALDYIQKWIDEKRKEWSA